MFPVFGYLVYDLMDMIHIGLAQLCRHIAIEYDFFRSARAKICEKFGLVLFGTVVCCLEIGAGDVFAVIHRHHLFSGIREEVLLDRHLSADEFKCDPRGIV